MGADPAVATDSDRARTPTPFSVYAALTGQTLISAGTYLAAKRAMVDLPPITLLMCRFLLSVPLFVVVLAAAGRPRLPPREAWVTVITLGILAGPINQGFFFYGLSRSLPSHAALVYALTPVGVFLYALLRGHERTSPRVMAGIGLAFGGAVVLLLGRGLRAAAGPAVGDLFIFVALAAWVLYTVDGRAFIAKYGWLRATAWTMTAGALLGSVAAPWLVDLPRLTHASGTTAACVVYLALLTSVVSYFLWYYALGRTAASKVAVFSNLQPVATALAAWAFFGDPLTWEIGVGGVLVLWGVSLTQTGRARG